MALSPTATVNAEATIGPRVYYAMAKNKASFKAAFAPAFFGTLCCG
jgi:hypothetical protein